MIFRHIKKLVSRRSGFELSSVAPDEDFYAIGDIHGRFDLLEMLLAELDPARRLVFVGDYIDRGENSAQVLRHLHALCQQSDGQIVCLKGNHEDMLLNFLDNPADAAPIWLRNGGDQTLAAFGIAVDETDPDSVADALRQAMGQPLIDWITELPLHWTTGNVTAVHAALDPAISVEDQSERVCLWGHPRFRQRPRRDGQWVVHGHTIMTQPTVAQGIISVDTGAFATNQLTAAEISGGQVQFMSTGRNGVVRL